VLKVVLSVRSVWNMHKKGQPRKFGKYPQATYVWVEAGRISIYITGSDMVVR
jgi:hypothetical protein